MESSQWYDIDFALNAERLAFSLQLSAFSLQPSALHSMPHAPSPTPYALLLILAACAPSTPRATNPVPATSLAGVWDARFVLDSQLTSLRDDPVLRWRRGPDTARALGTIEIEFSDAAADTTQGEPRRLKARMSVDFSQMLGRPMSCYQPGRREIEVERGGQGLGVAIAFTPDVADCGFGGIARWLGDTLRGVWSETSFVGPSAVGKFELVRRGS